MANFMTNFRPSRRILAMLVVVYALLFSYNEVVAENVAQGVKVVVIDAGHGGSRYPGASYGGYAEKDINLQVALKLGALIEKNLPEVKVVYTRTTDKMFSSVLSQDLQARADIAHKNGGDLFISIHSNAARSTSTRGVETLIMGESAMEQRANENTLYINNKEELLDMSDQKTATIVRAYIQNLQFTYGEYSEMMARLIQEEYIKLGYANRGVRRQPLKVLYATDMPSVLTEIGFMSNPAELKHITSEKGQKEIAGAIFRAVKQYIANVRRSLLLDSAAPVVEPKPTPQAKPEPSKESTSTQPKEVKPERPVKKSEATTVKRYAIQIMASVKKIPTDHPELKSYRGKVWVLESTSALKYKYCYGDYADKGAAQKYIDEVRKEFPQAFIITFDK
jgi:N-acetylmuramoyl-L-alanine amidase